MTQSAGRQMMKKWIVILPCVTFAVCAWAQHREHGAHVHGGGTLAIAFDEMKGRVEFRAASAGVVGFEHEASTTKDKKTLQGVIAQFEKNIPQFVQFDSSLRCHFSKDKIGMVKEAHHDQEESGEHSDFVADFDVTCVKSIAGSKITVDFSSFSALKDLDITVLVGSMQKSAEAKGKPVIIDLQ
jgi:hypothetical protein